MAIYAVNRILLYF